MNSYFKHKMRGKSPAVIAGMIALGIIAITGLAILFGFIVMWLWNWLMPEIFGLPLLSYWQAVGLFILFKILLGGCGHHKHAKHKSEHRCHDGKKHRKDFNKWSHYDKFWEEEGEKAYQKYVDASNDKHNDSSNSAE